MAGTGFLSKVIKALRSSKPQEKMGVTTIERCTLPYKRELPTGTLTKVTATTKRDFGDSVVRSYQKLNIFEPTPGSNLGNIGVREIRAMIRPGKTQIMANVNINGKAKYLDQEQLRDYINMMRPSAQNGSQLGYQVLRF